MLNQTLFPESSKIKLSDGADLYCLHTNEYKRSRLDIFFSFPADKYKSPLMRLLLSVLFRGSKNFPSITDMNKYLDCMYDSTVYWKDYHIGANHSYRIICTTLDKQYLPKRHADLDLLGETLRVIEDVLTEPLYDIDGLISKKHFESERDFAIDNINAKLNSPKSYAAIKSNEMLFGDDPTGYSLDGTEELFRSYTREDITSIREYFLKSAKITAFYVGTHTGEEVSQKLAPLFKKIGERQPVDIIPPYPIVRDGYREAEEEFELSQGILRVNLTCNSILTDADNSARSLYNEILGGSSTSKLFMNVREKKSLCYYCGSRSDNTCGVLTVACGIKPENKQAALEEIKKQILEMKLGNISDEEIFSAKKSLINFLRQTPDSSGSLVASGFKDKLLTGENKSINQRIKMIEDVKKEEIVEFAQKINICSVFFLTSNGQTHASEEYYDE